MLTYLSIYLSIYIYICMYVYVYVYIYLYIYIYIYYTHTYIYIHTFCFCNVYFVGGFEYILLKSSTYNREIAPSPTSPNSQPKSPEAKKQGLAPRECAPRADCGGSIGFPRARERPRLNVGALIIRIGIL